MSIDIKQSIGDPIAVDIGNKDIQGRVVSKTVQFSFFTTNENAVWIGRRQLLKESYPFALLKISLNRKAFRLEVGDCFKFSYSPYGISNMICRVLQKEEENLESENLNYYVMEDIFSVNKAAEVYTAPTDHSTPRTDYSLSPFTNQLIVEAPYAWTEDIEIIPLAARESNQDLGFSVYISIDGGTSYSLIETTVNLTPFGTLIGSTYPADTYSIDDYLGFTILFENENDVSLIETITWAEVLGMTKNNAFFGNDTDGYEIVTFQTITQVSGLQYKIENIIRGRLDTKRQSHPVGDKFFFIGEDADILFHSEIAAGISRKFKLVPYNVKFDGDISTATIINLSIAGRAKKPYIPSNFCANGSNFAARYDTDIVLTWSPRYRGKGAGIGIPGQVLADDDIDGHFEVEVWVGGVLKRTVNELETDTWTYTEVMNITDNGGLANSVLFKLLDYSIGEGVTYESDQVTVTCKKN